jgi:hypothetical protein
VIARVSDEGWRENVENGGTLIEFF